MKLKITHSLLLLSLLVAFTLAFAGIRQAGRKPASALLAGSYETLWKRVDSLDQKGLQKSALAVVLKIYEKASIEKNPEQLTKAVIHRIKYTDYTEEEGTKKAIAGLQAEIAKAEFPERPLLHSMLAELYWNFYRNNRYRFLQRTETAGYKNDDIDTWSARQLVNTVLNEYELSLADAGQSKKAQVNIFDKVLIKGKGDGPKFRPSLYDFLAHRALAFYMNEESGLTRPANEFTMSSAFYMNDADVLLNFMLKSPDSTSFEFKAIALLQNLIAFHQDDAHPGALIDVDMMRLRFVHQHLTISSNDSLYNVALQHLADRYKEYPGCTEALYEQALLANVIGGKYREAQEEKYKWMLLKAESYCDQAIARFPYSTGGLICKELKREINQKELSFQVEQVNIPDKPFRARVSYRNINTLYGRVLRNEQSEPDERYGDRKERVERLVNTPVLQSFTVELPADTDKQAHSIEIALPRLSPGRYTILLSAAEDFTIKEGLAFEDCRVSSLSVIHRRYNDASYEFFILDRESGQPVRDVTANILFRQYNYKTQKYDTRKISTELSDPEGRVQVAATTDNYRNFYVELVKGSDRLFLDQNFYQYASPPVRDRLQEQTVFFTDRSIYRPGQLIYFKGIVFEGRDENAKLRIHQPTTVQFYDVNGELISEQSLVTSDYGTFNGTFTAPQGILTGQMRIQNKSGSRYFSVEEYKRPKFEVTMETVKGSYRLGQRVVVNGKAQAFAGNAIDHASVKYRVERKARVMPWYFRSPSPWPSSATVEVANGTATTNVDGSFQIVFDAIPDLKIPRESNPVFYFTISVDVTDQNGETRSGDATLQAGYTAIELTSSLKQIYNISTDSSILVFSKNLSGEKVPLHVNLTVKELRQPDRLLRDRLWKSCDKLLYTEKEYHTYFPNDCYSNETDPKSWSIKREIWTGTLETAQDSVLHMNEKLAPGIYVLEASATDAFSQAVKLQQFFTVVDPARKDVPVNDFDWFTILKDDAQPGGEDVILIGSAGKDVHVIYELEAQGKIISRTTLHLEKEQQLVKIPVKEEYRGGFAVHFSFVKGGRAYLHSHTMPVAWDNKSLVFTYETFRSFLIPGQKEEWRIRISGKNGEKVAAEMLASMYDASLDAFQPHTWGFQAYSDYRTLLNVRPLTFAAGTSEWFKEFVAPRGKPEFAPERSYDELNWFGYELTGRHYVRGVRGENQLMEIKSDAATGNVPGVMAMAAPASPGDAATKEEEQASLGEIKNEKSKDSSPAVRRNLNETAFFYPELKTDENGDVIISFTSPEALTRWKFMAFASTTDLKFGLTEKEIRTQKKIMVIPNAPRFLREGDRISFPAKITSLSDTTLSGNVRLQLFDALSMQPLDGQVGNLNSTRSLTLKKGESVNFTWDLSIPEGLGAIVYRITAQAGEFGDGEEQVLPVLSNKLLVTESLPVWTRDNMPANFELTKLVKNSSTTLRNQKLTFEYTPNPAWTAIQALPYMMEYPYECSEQVFSRYYANAIASHVANANPGVKAVFESWKAESREAFLSNLEKNQDLKSLLLEETPWVAEAKDESERKKRIGVLFDLNRMSNELSSAVRKLRKAQTSNGAWPWFEGMPEDRYITQHIVAGMGHLEKLGVADVRKDADTWRMVSNAINYLDQKCAGDYRELLKDQLKHDDYRPGSLEIQYLYARSFFPEVPVPDYAKQAFSFYLGQSKKFWLQNDLYLQGMLSLVMNRNSEKEVATDILKSLKERALQNRELGMYWKENSSGYSWWNAPVETQALLIEAFDEIGNDQLSVDAMKIWLLRQKQTQDWKTTKATAEACYALLLRGSAWLDEPVKMNFYVGGKLLNVPGQAEAGSGYFKTSWTGTEIRNEMGKVELQPLTSKGQQATGISWGALYWQYFEEMDKITSAATPLQLKKDLFVERASATGPVLELLAAQSDLKVGDRVKVRIELRVDRDMEYVHMKDLRASGFEPENVISHYQWQDGLGYYESTRDASTNFFFAQLSKGTYVFEYPLRAFQAGDFSNGITSIECMYAPEFSSHSSGERVLILGK